MTGGLIIPDKKTAKALNDLARHTAILRILEDVRMDLEICEIEGWDKTEYIKQLKKLLDSIQPEQQWIPCSERLPEVRQWVLCQCRAGIMDVLRLTEDGSWDKNYPRAEYMSGFVVAWMPLPKPYEVKE